MVQDEKAKIAKRWNSVTQASNGPPFISYWHSHIHIKCVIISEIHTTFANMHYGFVNLVCYLKLEIRNIESHKPDCEYLFGIAAIHFSPVTNVQCADFSLLFIPLYTKYTFAYALVIKSSII